VSLLRELGYTNVRDDRGVLADWVESGGALEALDAAQSDGLTPVNGPALTVAGDGVLGRAQARIAHRHGWNDSVLGLVDSMSTAQLFLVWLLMILFCGFAYWFAALIGEHGLVEGGAPVGINFKGFADAIYFSFVTATSVGYGDVVPVGIARAIAVAEAITALLIFGAVIAKFVSHRQDELVGEIHRITFDERLDRVQSNLHVVISELLDLTSICEGTPLPPNRLGARLDSTVLLFQGEARTTHDLLYQPRLMVEEGVLASILANFSSALEVLSELLTCMPAEFRRSQSFQIALTNTVRLADDICSNCVPHQYTPRLRFWMDRIQATARRIK